MPARRLFLLLLPFSLVALGPQPGDVYREYRQVMRGGKDWRVTDPESPQAGAREFLPNSTLRIRIDDLQGATRAEALIDRWGGHDGTTAKRIRFNGNAWIDLPELATTPPGEPSIKWCSQDNPVVHIPLTHIKEGENTFEGTCGRQIGYKTFNWGQWGWTSIVVRIYYGRGKPHPSGQIVSPRAGVRMEESPRLEARASSPVGIARVDFLAWYDGIDENGDGVYGDWHHTYFHNIRQSLTDGEPAISGHVGSATGPPFAVNWDTRWVPDQPPGGMKVLARIQDRDGMWFVTKPVERLTLARKGESVVFYKPQEVPPRFSVRNKKRMFSKVTIPESENLGSVQGAALVLRTWNGIHERFRVNGYEAPIHGENHAYRLSIEPIPQTTLKRGESQIVFYSETLHHGVEVLWPGPGLLVRYKANRP